MKVDRELDLKTGKIEISLGGIQSSDFDMMEDFTSQLASILSQFSEAVLLEQDKQDFTPETPGFRVVARSMLMTRAYLSQAMNSSQEAVDLLSGKTSLDDHPLLFDDE